MRIKITPINKLSETIKFQKLNNLELPNNCQFLFLLWKNQAGTLLYTLHSANPGCSMQTNKWILFFYFPNSVLFIISIEYNVFYHSIVKFFPFKIFSLKVFTFKFCSWPQNTANIQFFSRNFLICWIHFKLNDVMHNVKKNGTIYCYTVPFSYLTKYLIIRSLSYPCRQYHCM